MTIDVSTDQRVEPQPIAPPALRPAPTSADPDHVLLDHFLLGGAPDDVALVDGDTSITYHSLRAAVEERAHDLSGTAPLVLPMHNDLASVVSYLAALALHRPVILLEAGERAAVRRRDIVERYAPAIGSDPAAPEPHPDLALLLSTSGSTGSPKLVRLSRDNLLANAAAIADYLDLRSTDRAITALPLHYCYGLSVLHSHLVAGASVVLTEASVADETFWDLAVGHGVTGLAGVPYTFDVFSASGFAERDLPSLRYVTQAGGRLAAERVQQLADLGRARGWDLYVMYGQTEATARMAYLPPALTHSHSGCVGVAVPGGAFRLHLPDADGVGELIYSGPNVMMGYASTPDDLARGADLAELFTGDLARIGPDGVVEIVGRSDRVAKVFGLRIDLERVEQTVAELDPDLRLLADGDVLHAFTERSRSTGRIEQAIADHVGLPASAVHGHRLATLPRTSAGKVDEAALLAHARSAATIRSATRSAAVSTGVRTGDAVSPDDLRDLYAQLLGRPDAGLDDSFVGLGGDSLSYVELSTRLGALLGRLPRSWPSLSVRELAAQARGSRRWMASLEISVVLRALAIALIVITHTDLALVPGGAHVLLAVAGYHLARFTLPTSGRRARTRRILLGVAAVAVPSSLWIAGCAVVTGDYRLSTAAYLNGVRSAGDPRWTLDWQFWFLEELVWGFLAVALLLAVPAVDRWQRRAPFAAAAVAVTVTAALRYASIGRYGEGVERYAVPSVLFVLALGWAAAEARTTAQRVAVLLASCATLSGFFGEAQRELIVVAGVGALLWLRPVLAPHVLAYPLRLLAASSLWIYLTHWFVYPPLEAAGRPGLALLASLAAGVLAHEIYRRAALSLRRIRGGPSPGRAATAGQDKRYPSTWKSNR
ncbi:MAG: AMP-binding protein [Nocardioides sp.]